LRLEIVRFSEMLVFTYKPTGRYKPEDQRRHIHGRENLKSYRIHKIAALVYRLCSSVWSHVEAWNAERIVTKIYTEVFYWNLPTCANFC
jgi:hypothetical protein